MRKAIKHHLAADAPLLAERGTITLAFADRHKRRIRLSDDEGAHFLLDLPHAVLMNQGDLLELDDGGAIKVLAAAEAVTDAVGKDVAHTARLAWHIGNRHTPVQVLDSGAVRIREDQVLTAMLIGQEAEVENKMAPFAPEPGAYSAGGGHSHDDDHWHSIDDDPQDHEHGHDHVHG